MVEYDPCKHCPYSPCKKVEKEKRLCFTRMLILLTDDETKKIKEFK